MSGHGTDAPRPVHARDRGVRDADELRRFALRRLIEREAERQRISRALHDELGQALSALNLGLYRIARRHPEDMDLLGLVDELRAVVDEGARGTRRLAAGFRPGNAIAGPLRAVVLAAVERFRTESGLHCLAAVDDPAANIPLEQPQATALQTLLLLALNGVARHRPAAHALVHARAGERCVVIEIRDPARPGVRERILSRPNARGRTARTAEFDELEEWLRALGGALRLGDIEASVLLRLELPLPERFGASHGKIPY